MDQVRRRTAAGDVADAAARVRRAVWRRGTDTRACAVRFVAVSSVNAAQLGVLRAGAAPGLPPPAARPPRGPGAGAAGARRAERAAREAGSSRRRPHGHATDTREGRARRHRRHRRRRRGRDPTLPNIDVDVDLGLAMQEGGVRDAQRRVAATANGDGDAADETVGGGTAVKSSGRLGASIAGDEREARDDDSGDSWERRTAAVRPAAPVASAGGREGNDDDDDGGSVSSAELEQAKLALSAAMKAMHAPACESVGSDAFDDDEVVSIVSDASGEVSTSESRNGSSDGVVDKHGALSRSSAGREAGRADATEAVSSDDADAESYSDDGFVSDASERNGASREVVSVAAASSVAQPSRPAQAAGSAQQRRSAAAPVTRNPPQSSPSERPRRGEPARPSVSPVHKVMGDRAAVALAQQRLRLRVAARLKEDAERAQRAERMAIIEEAARKRRADAAFQRGRAIVLKAMAERRKKRREESEQKEAAAFAAAEARAAACAAAAERRLIQQRRLAKRRKALRRERRAAARRRVQALALTSPITNDGQNGNRAPLSARSERTSGTQNSAPPEGRRQASNVSLGGSLSARTREGAGEGTSRPSHSAHAEFLSELREKLLASLGTSTESRPVVTAAPAAANDVDNAQPEQSVETAKEKQQTTPRESRASQRYFRRRMVLLRRERGWDSSSVVAPETGSRPFRERGGRRGAFAPPPPPVAPRVHPFAVNLVRQEGIRRHGLGGRQRPPSAPSGGRKSRLQFQGRRSGAHTRQRSASRPALGNGSRTHSEATAGVSEAKQTPRTATEGAVEGGEVKDGSKAATDTPDPATTPVARSAAAPASSGHRRSRRPLQRTLKLKSAEKARQMNGQSAAAMPRKPQQRRAQRPMGSRSSRPGSSPRGQRLVAAAHLPSRHSERETTKPQLAVAGKPRTGVVAAAPSGNVAETAVGSGEARNGEATASPHAVDLESAVLAASGPEESKALIEPQTRTIREKPHRPADPRRSGGKAHGNRAGAPNRGRRLVVR